MASVAVSPHIPARPAERFFRVSLFFFIFTAVGTLVSTGKQDPVTCVMAPAAMLFKGWRWWRGKLPEFSHRSATWMVIGYLAIFPVDVLFLSRGKILLQGDPKTLPQEYGQENLEELFISIAHEKLAMENSDGR